MEFDFQLVPGDLLQREQSVQNRTPILLRFSLELPSVEARGGWKERGYMRLRDRGNAVGHSRRIPKLVVKKLRGARRDRPIVFRVRSETECLGAQHT